MRLRHWSFGAACVLPQPGEARRSAWTLRSRAAAQMEEGASSQKGILSGEAPLRLGGKEKQTRPQAGLHVFLGRDSGGLYALGVCSSTECGSRLWVCRFADGVAGVSPDAAGKLA